MSYGTCLESVLMTAMLGFASTPAEEFHKVNQARDVAQECSTTVEAVESSLYPETNTATPPPKLLEKNICKL